MTGNENAQQENEDDEEELPELDTTELPDETSSTNPKPIDSFKFRPIFPDEENEMCRQVRMMSFEQRICLDKIVFFCNEVVRARKFRNMEPDPPKLIVHGEGGCGKSFLIKVLSKWAEKILRCQGEDNQLQPKVLLLGPTGKPEQLKHRKT